MMFARSNIAGRALQRDEQTGKHDKRWTDSGTYALEAYKSLCRRMTISGIYICRIRAMSPLASTGADPVSTLGKHYGEKPY